MRSIPYGPQKCTGPCGQVKPPGAFTKNSRKKNGLCCVCKDCQRSYREQAEVKARLDAYNKGPIAKENKKRYRASEKGQKTEMDYSNSPKAKESAAKRGLKYQQSERGKQKRREYGQSPGRKAWIRKYSRGPERKEQQRQFSKTDRFRESQERYRNSLKGKAKYRTARQRRYGLDSSREKRQAYNQSASGLLSRRVTRERRRTRNLNLPLQWSTADWKRCLEYWNHRCAICGHGDDLFFILSMDHWIPITAEGDNPGTVPSNVLPLCFGKRGGVGACNNSKSFRDPIEWLTEKLGPANAAAKLAEINAYFASVRPAPATA